ncbi:MAG: hypothetical protein HYZ53_20435 [Planctomycetes bacterium]|nr:hypothetical protein [Planctomycetota bacterium]
MSLEPNPSRLRRLFPVLEYDQPFLITIFVTGCVIVSLAVLYLAVSLKWISLG